MSKITFYDLFDAPAPTLDPMPFDDEVADIAAAKAGNKAAADRLLTAYIPALRGAATREYKRLRDTHDMDEVRSLVLLAFTEAIHTTNPDSRLAGNLKGRIQHATHNDALPPSAVSVPPRTYSRFVQIMDAAEGDWAKAEELAPGLGMTVEVLRAVRDARHTWGSLDATMESASGADWEPNLASLAEETGYATVEQAAIVEAAFAAVDALAALVIRDAYGFTEYEPIPDAEIAHRRGYSRSKVQRIRTEGLVTMHAVACDGHEGRCNRPELHPERELAPLTTEELALLAAYESEVTA